VECFGDGKYWNVAGSLYEFQNHNRLDAKRSVLHTVELTRRQAHTSNVPFFFLKWHAIAKRLVPRSVTTQPRVTRVGRGDEMVEDACQAVLEELRDDHRSLPIRGGDLGRTRRGG
jgi:hypothetical protein